MKLSKREFGKGIVAGFAGALGIESFVSSISQLAAEEGNVDLDNKIEELTKNMRETLKDKPHLQSALPTQEERIKEFEARTKEYLSLSVDEKYQLGLLHMLKTPNAKEYRNYPVYVVGSNIFVNVGDSWVSRDKDGRIQINNPLIRVAGDTYELIQKPVSWDMQGNLYRLKNTVRVRAFFYDVLRTAKDNFVGNPPKGYVGKDIAEIELDKDYDAFRPRNLIDLVVPHR